jgi:hypothetical protein
MLGAHGAKPPVLLHAGGQPVARALELLEAEQARSEDRLTCGSGRGDVGKAAGHDRRELVLEPCDLRPQRTPRGALANVTIDQ